LIYPIAEASPSLDLFILVFKNAVVSIVLVFGFDQRLSPRDSGHDTQAMDGGRRSIGSNEMIPLEKGVSLASMAAINFVWSIERIDA
jgi:hypothetical protein